MRLCFSILAIFSLLISMVVLADVWYYGSGEAVNLENKIGFDKHSQKIISGVSTDPKVVGVAAASGSLILHTASGGYIKNGPADTNWGLISLDAGAGAATLIQDVGGTTSAKTANTPGILELTGASRIDSLVGATTLSQQTGTYLQVNSDIVAASGSLMVGNATGAGGSSADSNNILTWGNFEKGISNMFSTVGTMYHSSVDKFMNNRSLKVDLSSETMNISSAENTTAQFTGMTTEMSCMIKSTLDSVQVCAIDASNNELGCSGTYDGSNIWKLAAVTFTNAGVTKLKIKTIEAETGTVYIDDCYAGVARASSLSIDDMQSWTTFTPTGSWSSNVTYAGKWRKVGEEMEVRVRIDVTGTPDTATLTVNLPSGGYTIDTAKLPTSWAGNAALGQVSILDPGNYGYQGVVVYNNTTSVKIQYYNLTPGGASVESNVTQAAPITFANADNIQFNFKVPITGWAATSKWVATPATTGVENYYLTQTDDLMSNQAAEIQYNFSNIYVATKNGSALTYANWQDQNTNLVYVVNSVSGI